MNRRDALERVALLMGGVLSAPTLLAFSGKHTATFPTDASFKFTKEQKALVSEFAEVIIPKTNTPGAKEAKVADFIEIMLRDCYEKGQQEYFIKGISEVEAEAKKQGGTFVAIPAAKKTLVVKTMSDIAKNEAAQTQQAVKQIDTESGLEKQSVKKAATMVPFFTLMKELTVLGYFTSEPGATKALDFVAIPGKYQGCIKMKPGQKAWAN